MRNSESLLDLWQYSGIIKPYIRKPMSAPAAIRELALRFRISSLIPVKSCFFKLILFLVPSLVLLGKHSHWLELFFAFRRQNLRPSLDKTHQFCYHSGCIRCWCDNNVVSCPHNCLNQGIGCWCKIRFEYFHLFCGQFPQFIHLSHLCTIPQIILLVIAVGQIIARTFAAAPLHAHAHAAPIPVVYSRSDDQAAASPIWVEKEWSR